MIFAAVLLKALCALASALGVIWAGHRRVQIVFIVIAYAAGLLGIALTKHSVGGARGFTSDMATIAGLGLLAFCSCNLLSRLGERWAFRVVIYGFYAAAFATAGALFAAHTEDSEGVSRREWIGCAAIYAFSSILIVSSKPWLAKRMLQ